LEAVSVFHKRLSPEFVSMLKVEGAIVHDSLGIVLLNFPLFPLRCREGELLIDLAVLFLQIIHEFRAVRALLHEIET
jgi:hypothetical protein